MPIYLYALSSSAESAYRSEVATFASFAQIDFKKACQEALDALHRSLGRTPRLEEMVAYIEQKHGLTRAVTADYFNYVQADR